MKIKKDLYIKKVVEYFISKNIISVPIVIIDLITKLDASKKNHYYRYFFSLTKDKYTEKSIKYGKFIADRYPDDVKFNRVLSTRYIRIGKIDECVEIEKRIVNLSPDQTAFERISIYASEHLKKAINEIIENHGANKVQKIIELISLKYNLKIIFTDNSILYESYKDKSSFIKRDKNSLIIDKYKELYSKNKITMNTWQLINNTAFFSLKDKHPDIAIHFGEELTKSNTSDTFNRYLGNCYFRIGNISKSLFHLKKSAAKNNDLIEKYEAFDSLRKKGFTSYPARNINFVSMHEDKSVVYLLHNSLPYFSGGYATRSNGVMGGIKDNGWSIRAISRLGFPNDTKKGPAIAAEHHEHGINYSLLIDDLISVYNTPADVYLYLYGEALYEKLKNSPPKIIHAASFYMNGIAAVYAAKKLGCKSVYEVRGLQELSKISRHPYWLNSEHYKFYEKMETQAALDADAVFTLTAALKNEFINRGVPADKISILPNGVHSDRFKPVAKNEEILDSLNLRDCIVIGFVGSFVDYEGIDVLLQSIKICRDTLDAKFHLLMVGDGAYYTEAVQLANELGISEIVTFTGRIPHDDVEKYYSVIDICPLPRKGLPVCEMVSPLKPFEAMAMGKVVIASDVAALAEIVDDGVTGLLHKKDDHHDLANKISELITDHDLRTRLGKAAREWVVSERDWKVIAKRVDTVYHNLLAE